MNALRPGLLPALVLAAAVAGCGAQAQGGTDVGAFARQAQSAEARAVLHTIGVYRTSKDLRRACSLITPHFLKARFDGYEQECEYFSQQAPRRLPRSARVASIDGTRARVDIREYSATRSVYVLVDGAAGWRIDDIATPPGARGL